MRSNVEFEEHGSSKYPSESSDEVGLSNDDLERLKGLFDQSLIDSLEGLIRSLGSSQIWFGSSESVLGLIKE